jgi:zinc/manganese transport system permease protein
MVFLVVLALIVTGAARLVGTLLVLSLAITPDAAAQQLSASPLAADGLSILFAVIAADGGLLVSFETSNVKASVFITSNSFTIYLLARQAPCCPAADTTTAPAASPTAPPEAPWPGLRPWPVQSAPRIAVWG